MSMTNRTFMVYTIKPYTYNSVLICGRVHLASPSIKFFTTSDNEDEKKKKSEDQKDLIIEEVDIDSSKGDDGNDISETQDTGESKDNTASIPTKPTTRNPSHATASETSEKQPKGGESVVPKPTKPKTKMIDLPSPTPSPNPTKPSSEKASAMDNQEPGGTSELLDLDQAFSARGTWSDDGYSSERDPFATILPPATLQLLSITTESATIQKESTEIFKKFVENKNIYIVPDEHLSHFKDTRNASEVSKVCLHDPYILYKTWEYLDHKYNIGAARVMDDLYPISEYYLSSLDRSIRNRDEVVKLPIFALAPLNGNTISKILYGISLGAYDLIPFLQSEHYRMSFKYEFNSQLTNKSSYYNNISFDLFKEGVESADYSFTTKFEDKVFNYSEMQNRYVYSSRNTMVNSGNFRKMLLDMIYLNNSEYKMDPFVKSSSHRTTILTRTHNGNSTAMIDGFEIMAVINNDFKIRINDHGIVYMLMSLLYCGNMGWLKNNSSGGNRMLSRVLNYVSTIIHSYIVDQMYIHQKVEIESLSIRIDIVKRPDLRTQESLDEKYLDLIKQGCITPISTLHYLNAIKSVDGEVNDINDSDHIVPKVNFDIKRFTKFIVLSSLSCPPINKHLESFMPSLDTDSRFGFKNYMIDSSNLDSNSYVSEVRLPWQAKDSIKLPPEYVIFQMAVRTFLSNDVPEYFPLITRGQWKGPHSTSWSIFPPNYHRIAKYCTSDYLDKINKSVIDFSLHGITKPIYIRKLTRVVSEMPSLYDRMLPLDEE